MIQKNKKLILIGGFAHTGTTMMGLILANEKNGFACGEVYAIFRREDKDINKAPNNPLECSHWHKVVNLGEKRMHPYLLRHFDVVTDSSKVVSWIRDINKWHGERFKVYNIVMWKKPINAYYSVWKRHKREVNDFVNYYKKYYESYRKEIPTHVMVNMETFISNPEKQTELLCKKLGLNYFIGKSEFWKKKFHFMFGAGAVGKVIRGKSPKVIESSIEYQKGFPVSKARKQLSKHDWRFLRHDIT